MLRLMNHELKGDERIKQTIITILAVINVLQCPTMSNKDVQLPTYILYVEYVLSYLYLT